MIQQIALLVLHCLLMCLSSNTDGAFIRDMFYRSIQEMMGRFQEKQEPRKIAEDVLVTLLKKEKITPSEGFFTAWRQKLIDLLVKEPLDFDQVKRRKGSVSSASGIVLGVNAETGKNLSISEDELRNHGYLLGATGTGKSTSLVGISSQLIKDGVGLAFFDPSPHGTGMYELLGCIPESRVHDVFVFDPASTTASGSMGINLLEKTAEPMSVAIERAMNIFDRLYGYRSDNPAYGERMKNLMRQSFFTLMHNDCTLAELPTLLLNAAVRKRLLANVPNTMQDHYVRSFWEEEYNELVDFKQEEWAAPVLNKVTQLLTDEFVLPIVSQKKTTFDVLNLMQEKKIFLVHLPKNKLGEGARFLGIILVSELVRAAFNRPASSMPLFGLVIDEFQEFASSEFLDLLPTIRKQNVFVLLANQVYTQLKQEMQGVVNQVATQWTFRVTPADSEKRAPLHAKKPTVEYKEQEKKLPVSNPFDWLTSGHTHTNPVVNRYADGTLREIHTALSSEYSKELRAEFNSFLYRAMTSSDPLAVLCEKASLSLLLRLNDKYPFGTYYFGQTVVSLPEVKIKNYTVSNHLLFLNIPHLVRYSSARYIFEDINMPVLVAERKGNTLDEHMATALTAMIQAVDENQFKQASAYFASLAEEKLRKRITAYLEEYKQRYEKISYTAWTLIKDYTPNPTFLSPEEEAEKWNKELERWMTEERTSFETFIKEFRDFVLALAKEPITSSSGMYEMVEVGRRTVADMVNDMAQELIQLPNHVAYVKRGTSGEKSVKIQTVPLEPGCSLEELEQRKRTITENTLPYTTKRAEVEQELQQRHTAYTTGKKPQVQPQPQQRETTQEPQPAKEETQSHHAIRRVCPASDTLPSEQHPVVCTDEKTTGDTYLTLLYYFSHLTLQQAVRLTGKQTSISNERAKLTKLVKDGLVVSETMKENVSSGRAPLAYSVTAKGYKYLETEKGLPPLKKGDYSLHSYQVNETLIPAILATKTHESIRLVGFEHEKMFRMKPLQLPNGKGVEPDSLLIYQVGQNIAPIAWECDLSIETKEQLLDKCQKYLQALQGPYKDRFGVVALTIAFVIPNGSENDVARLVGIIEAALETHKEAASLFLVGAFDPVNIEPGDLLFTPLFSQPFDVGKHALIEKQAPILPSTSQDATTTTNEERSGTDSLPDVPQQQETPAPVPARDKNLKRLTEQFLRHEKRLLYEIAGHYDGTPIDDPDLEKPIQERIEEIKTDPDALKAFLRKNKGGCNKFANPKDGKDACYLARSTFAVRAAQRVLGEPLLPWSPLMQQLLAQVTHPDLQRVIQEDRGFS